MSKEKNKEQIALIQNYIKVFETDEGRKVLKDLMNHSYLLQPTAAANEMLSNRNEGKRELMLHILHNLSYDVQSLLDLIDESKNENREKKAYGKNDDDFDFFID